MSVLVCRLRFLACAVVFSVAACSPGTPPVPFPTPLPNATTPAATQTSNAAPTAVPLPTSVASAASAAPTVTPAPAGCASLRVAYWKPPTILNPHLAGGQEDIDASRLVLEPLAAVDPRGTTVPVLAARIPTLANGDISTDFVTTTWKLKQGVQWSDGSEFTAEDVVFTYRYVTDPAVKSTDGVAFEAMRSVDAIDKHTVRVVWREPNPIGTDGFSGQSGAILQKRQFEALRGATARTGPNPKPIGTGPFVVQSMAPGDQVVFTANPLYRDANRGKPCFRRVTIWGAADPVTAARQVFVSGDVDYAWNLSIDNAALSSLSAAADAKATLLTVRTAAVERLSFNRTNPSAALGDRRSEPVEKGGEPHPFLADRRVREALAMVIDRKAISAKAFGQAALETCNLLVQPPGAFSARNCPPAGDAAFSTAARLLDDAGWTMRAGGIRARVIGGRTVPMSVLFQTSQHPARKQSQLLIKGAWERLGLSVELKTIPHTLFFSNDEFAVATAAKFFADVQMLASEPATADPAPYLRTWTCGEVRTRAQKWSGNNYERFCSRDYDTLYERLLHEPDHEKRLAMATRLQDILLDDFAIVPLVARTRVSAHSRTLRGVDMNGIWDSEMWNIADWSR